MQSTQQKNKTYPADVTEFVSELANEGYATFATHRKRPSAGGASWKDAIIDVFPTQDTYPCGEYGIVLRADDLVVDIDPRNFPEGRKVWSEFCAEFRIPAYIKKSKTIRSGSGGLHIYLKKPTGFQTRKSLPEFPGLDFLTAGNYTIGPGSFIPDEGHKTPYTVIVEGPALECPAELLNALIKQTREYTDEIYEAPQDTPDNIARFIEYLGLQPGAVQGQAGDLTTFKIACRGRDFNLSSDMCLKLLMEHYNPKCVPMWNEHELGKKIFNAYTYNEAPAGTSDPKVVLPILDTKPADNNDWIRLLDVSGVGTYKSTLKNAVLFLSHDKNLKGKFCFNQFTYKVELSGKLPWETRRFNMYREMNDLEVSHVALYMAQTYQVEFPTPKMWDALFIAASDHTRHPVREWLDSLVWDGERRLEGWLVKYCGVEDTPYSRAVGKKTLTAAVARIYQPGTKFDTVLILEGAQGIGKSTACAILGGKWFGDAPIEIHNIKDTIEYVHAHWIIEFGEMASVRRTEINILKTFISRTEDDARPAYARARVRFPRQSIFIGTINPEDSGYLADTDGNRRFWPVHCERFDNDALRRDRAQIFAEAVQTYKLGEKLYLESNILAEASVQAMLRVVKDPWENIIAHFLEKNPDINETTTEIMYTTVIGGSTVSMNTGHCRRIASVLRFLGFHKVRSNHGVRYARPVTVVAKTQESL